MTEDGEVLVNPDVKLKLRELWKGEKKVEQEKEQERDDENDTSDYDNLVAKMPKTFRDHCPDCYLEPLLRLFEQENRDR